MLSFLKNQSGAALIGLLLAVVVIAALAYGSSFFWKENADKTKTNTGGTQNIIKQYNQAKEDISEINQAADSRKQAADSLMLEDLNEADWDTLSREEEDFRLRYPHGWYYAINHEYAGELGYELIVGFGASEKAWEQEPPYEIEFAIAPDDLNFEEVPGRFNKAAAVLEDKQYLFIYYNQEYKEIVDRMAESFEVLKI